MASRATEPDLIPAPEAPRRGRRRREPNPSQTCQELLGALRAHDPATARHSTSVVGHAVIVARRLGLSEPELEEVELVALLHDVGKLAVPGRLLRKRDKLTDAEWTVMRRHAEAGAGVLEQLPEVAAHARAVRAHHERWDGAGYPDGLAGDDIPLASRITFVCDAYDAMTTDRPYRAARSQADAAAEIRREAGRQFCPRCTEALLAVLDPSGRVPAGAV
jgi:putative nucleotidyltransferase with HDIG domain